MNVHVFIWFSLLFRDLIPLGTSGGDTSFTERHNGKEKEEDVVKYDLSLF